jgi:hypothetical protein
MGTGCGPIGSLQEGYREGAEYGMGKEKKKSPFQGSSEGVVFLFGGYFMFP